MKPSLLRPWILLSLAALASCGGADSTNAPAGAAGAPALEAGLDADAGAPEGAAGEAGADATVDADSGSVCGSAILGYPCLTASNEHCPQGGLECYGIALKNVCGPPGRGCSPSATSCPGSDQKCYEPLIAGSSDGEGICLTESEMACFCSNIGVSLRPPFCPVNVEEFPGLGEYCSCSGFCPYQDGVGPCKPGLTCVRHQCYGPVCDANGPDTCPQGMSCTTFLDASSVKLGDACASF